MKCVSCNSEMHSNFKHAFLKNECPCCGKIIMNEEVMALIEDVERTILNEASVREETAKKLSFIIVSKYNIDRKEAATNVKVNTYQKNIKDEEYEDEDVKIYKKEQVQEESAKILEASALLNNKELNGIDKEKILEQVVKEKYNMISQAVDNFENLDAEVDTKELASIFSNSNKELEKDRLIKMSRQQKMLNGGGAFRRGS